MNTPIKIDFVSDVSCGWCAVGLAAIEQALRNVAPDAPIDFHFQPFELNPGMPAGGQNLNDYLKGKYGEQAALHYVSATRERGAAVGFAFNLDEQSRIYNTFDAHRLLHWAGLKGRQAALKHAFFDAHFTGNKDPGNLDVLLDCAEAAQLDRAQANAVLNSDAYAAQVREAASEWMGKGVHSVPTIIINNQYLVTGARSVASFEDLLREAIHRDPSLPVSSSLEDGA